MASFTLTIPDELLPAVVAEFNWMKLKASDQFPFTTPEEYLQASVVEVLRQRCRDYKVGQFYVGVTPPLFNPDGSLYQPPGSTEALG